MNRAAVGDLQKPLARIIVEVSVQNDLTFKLVDPAFLGLAFGTVRRVNFAVGHPHGGPGQREFFAAGV